MQTTIRWSHPCQPEFGSVHVTDTVGFEQVPTRLILLRTKWGYVADWYKSHGQWKCHLWILYSLTLICVWVMVQVVGVRVHWAQFYTSIDNKPVLVQLMAWCRKLNQLSPSSKTHTCICVTRPHWEKQQCCIMSTMTFDMYWMKEPTTCHL